MQAPVAWISVDSPNCQRTVTLCWGTETHRTAALLGAATIELVRALIASAADSPHQRDTVAESLMARITAYVHLHLGEADLDPARIAAEHNISVRGKRPTMRRRGPDSLGIEAWFVVRRPV